MVNNYSDKCMNNAFLWERRVVCLEMPDFLDSAINSVKNVLSQDDRIDEVRSDTQKKLDKQFPVSSDLKDLLKYREENKEKILEKYWLNEYLVKSLLNQGITVTIGGRKNEGSPDIDTSDKYHWVLDESGNIRSSRMSSLPIIGYKIDSIDRSSDGFTTFHLTDTITGKKSTEIFSEQKFEDVPNEAKIYYKNKLQLNNPKEKQVEFVHPRDELIKTISALDGGISGVWQWWGIRVEVHNKDFNKINKLLWKLYPKNQGFYIESINNSKLIPEDGSTFYVTKLETDIYNSKKESKINWTNVALRWKDGKLIKRYSNEKLKVIDWNIEPMNINWDRYNMVKVKMNDWKIWYMAKDYLEENIV